MAQLTIEHVAHHRRSGRTSVTVRRWRQTGQPSVALYSVIGGGHTIPNLTRRAVPLLGRTTCDIDAGALVGQLLDQVHPTTRPDP